MQNITTEQGKPMCPIPIETPEGICWNRCDIFWTAFLLKICTYKIFISKRFNYEQLGMSFHHGGAMISAFSARIFLSYVLPSLKFFLKAVNSELANRMSLAHDPSRSGMFLISSHAALLIRQLLNQNAFPRILWGSRPSNPAWASNLKSCIFAVNFIRKRTCRRQIQMF